LAGSAALAPFGRRRFARCGREEELQTRAQVARHFLGSRILLRGRRTEARDGLGVESRGGKLCSFYGQPCAAFLAQSLLRGCGSKRPQMVAVRPASFPPQPPMIEAAAGAAGTARTPAVDAFAMNMAAVLECFGMPCIRTDSKPADPVIYAYSPEGH